MLRTRTITTIGAVTLALAAPAGAGAQAAQDLRSPDARDASTRPAEVRQDLRSPDARDASTRPAEVRQDLRSPDARDAGTSSIRPAEPVSAVDRTAPVADGFEWGHAGIGGAAMLALMLGIGGVAILVTRRRVGAPFAH